LDKDAFLKLLVAQLKYQDPTKPADASAMVAQSAQLTMVERLDDIAAMMKESTSASRLSLAGALVGRDISFVDPDGYQVTARVDSARFDNGGLSLIAGTFSVPIGAVLAVQAPALTPDPTLALTA
jgi:flagellar basal-body rod modification protein FlgD